MSQHFLKRVVPNEQFQVVLEFVGSEYRVFDMSTLCKSKGWDKLAYPQHMKRFTVSETEVFWPEGGKVDANYLYENSRPIGQEQLEHQILRLSFKNQAPTSEDKSHHVYGVYLAPFSLKSFRVGESIGGGMADRGGGYDMSATELLEWPKWKRHFELSGCTWAIASVESLASKQEELFNLLISEACKRNGMPENV